MPGPALTFPMQLPPQVRRELEAFLAQLNEGYLYVEHKEDGTHGDIHADSITLIGSATSDESSGTFTLIDQDGIEIVLEATNEGVSTPGSQHSLNISVDGERAVQLGLMAPHAIFGSGHGLFIQDRSIGGGTDPTWGYTLSTGQQALLSGRSALGLTDTIEDKVILLVRPVGAPGAVSHYYIGPVSSLTLGTPVSLGRDTTGERFYDGAFDNNVRAAHGVFTADVTSIHGTFSGDVLCQNLGASGAVFAPIHILGTVDTNSVRLKLESAGVLGVRLGDDSAYAPVVAQYFQGVAALVSVGSVGSPSFTFTSDQDTGFYWIASNSIGVTLGGGLAVGFVDKTSTQGYGAAVANGAFGAGNVAGSFLSIGRNTSGGGAAGTLRLERKSGGFYYVWVDDTGVLRINNAAPEEDGTPSDTSGVAVGDQTSLRAAKHILGQRFDYDTSLAYVLSAPVYDFTYKDGRYNNEMFTGITTDESPVFGKDQGKALNEVSSVGHLIQAIKAQQTQIEKLRDELAELRKRVE